MRICMIVPYAFYRSSGSPLSIFYRIKALNELGHHIDVVTYHLGQDVEFENVIIYRIGKFPFISELSPGKVIPKIPLNIMLLMKSISILRKQLYDFIYTHGTAGLIGVVCKRIFKIPMIQDMHGIWTHEIQKWNFFPFPATYWAAGKLENYIIKKSDSIITTCKNVSEVVRKEHPDKVVFTVENAANENAILTDDSKLTGLKQRLHLNQDKIILYTGSFLKIQNIDMLIKSIAQVVQKRQDIKCILIGGSGKDFDKVALKIKSYDLAEYFICIKQKPKEEIANFLAISDILVSPRFVGIEIPMKIISYLAEGKPIVATDTPIHNQILSEDSAVLTKPNGNDFSLGILSLLNNENLRKRIGTNAKELYEKEYSYDAFRKKMLKVTQYVQSKIKSNTAVG